MSDKHLHFSYFKRRRLHLGVCGSIAAYKSADLLRAWITADIHVSATLTAAAAQFISPLTFRSLGAMPVYDSLWHNTENPFEHLEPGQTAHAMIIAPASAQTLSRLATGAASDMLSTQALAFDGPLVIAPAMNPRMWLHPATQENVATLRQRGAHIVLPEQGSTACGDLGQGRLADQHTLYLAALRALAPQDMCGLRILVTLGPTRESWDAVRFWSNPSTGRMGASLVTAAWLRGATVEAVCGPGCPVLPDTVRRHDVTSAREMHAAANDLWDQMDMGFFTAAVADFSPIPTGAAKFKKEQAQNGFTVQFTPNPDILRDLAQRRKAHQKVLGFAAETSEDLAACVQRKLKSKGADIIVGNRINEAGSGFATSTNSVLIADRNGREEQWLQQNKSDIAWDLCTWLLNL